MRDVTHLLSARKDHRQVATSIREIAMELGVSRTTVWRALNDLPRVDEDTKARVLQLAKEKGYNSGEATRKFIARRVSNIQFLVYDYKRLTYPFFYETLRGVQEVLWQYNCNIQVTSANTVSTVSGSCLPDVCSMKKNFIKGLIVFGVDLKHEDLKRLKKLHIPFMLLNSVPKDLDDDICYLYTDYEAGMYAATHHLIQIGHRKIAFINGSMELLVDYEKLKGYRRALYEAGLVFDKDYVIKGNYSWEDALKIARQTIDRNDRPTAIICADDTMALGAIAAIEDAGLRVPKDVAVVGFNDLQFAAISRPPLTSVSISAYNMGQLAAKMFMSLMAGKKTEPCHTILEPKLVVRASCGAKCRKDNLANNRKIL
ncbi:MAG: LacI family DNA-binding transcriptional regulator [bacterium]|nr:LacI family DNA-binding transcriptional regulator [bacterium]